MKNIYFFSKKLKIKTYKIKIIKKLLKESKTNKILINQQLKRLKREEKHIKLKKIQSDYFFIFFNKYFLNKLFNIYLTILITIRAIILINQPLTKTFFMKNMSTF